MAAVVQAQIRNFEEKAKPFLYEGSLKSQWSLIEQKTHVKREQIALGLLAVLILYLIFGWGNDFVCDLIGFIYPAYASLLAVGSSAGHNDTEWLVYWVVYASLGVVEYIGYNFFHTLPLYWLGKCLFLLWLMVPGSKGGAQVLYNKVLRPLVLKNQSNPVEKHVQAAKADINDYVSKVTN